MFQTLPSMKLQYRPLITTIISEETISEETEELSEEVSTILDVSEETSPSMDDTSLETTEELSIEEVFPLNEESSAET